MVTNGNLSNYYTLSFGTQILDKSDLNSYKEPGNYYCSGSLAAQQLINSPTKNAFVMKVELGTGINYPTQTITSFGDGKKYFRVYIPENTEWRNWVEYVTNTDLQTAIATGNTVRQCVNATTDSQTKKFLIARPDDAPIYESSRALLTVTKYTTFTFLTLQSTLNEVFVAFLYESNNITPSIWKRMDNTV